MKKLFYLSLCLLTAACTDNSEFEKLKRENEVLRKIVGESENSKQDKPQEQTKITKKKTENNYH